MQKIFISNAATQEPGSLVLDKSTDVADFLAKKVLRFDDRVFVIDVHCVCRGSESRQLQGGMVIYRHLLARYANNKLQEGLRVILYSPLSSLTLLKLKPENYALKLLPFIELTSEDGKFASDLDTTIAKYEEQGWLQLNSASENLLSGWAIANTDLIAASQEARCEKVQTPDNAHILFIDDDQSEWEPVFSRIFAHPEKLQYLGPEGDGIFTRQDYRDLIKADFEELTSAIFGCIDSSTRLILSDLYLSENHDVSQWKNEAVIKGISGFRLFDHIRQRRPEIPYVFHTSSNKAAVHKFFDSLGVDNWLIKDIRPDTAMAEKKEQFQDFKGAIEDILNSRTLARINEYWHRIELIRASSSKLWWEREESDRAVVLGYLENCWRAFRKYAKAANDNPHAGSHSEWFVMASITSGLGKVADFLAPRRDDDSSRIAWVECSSLFELAYQIRNCSSHWHDNNLFTPTDVAILYEVVFTLLESNRNSCKRSEPTLGLALAIGGESGGVLQQPHALFWIYLYFYANSRQFRFLKRDIQERLIAFLLSSPEIFAYIADPPAKPGLANALQEFVRELKESGNAHIIQRIS